nr:ATPase [Actinomycetota bacterium]
DPHWVVYEALLGVDVGDAERAIRFGAEVEALGERWPRWAARLWLTFSAHLAIIRNDTARIAKLIARLEPDATHWAVLGGGVLVDGPISVWIGRLEAARGDFKRAAAWLSTAEAAAQRLDADLWLFEARADRLAAQHALGTADDEELAVTTAAAQAHGLVPVADRLRALRHTVRRAPNVFRRDQDVWTLVFDGIEARMPDSKGLRDLQALLANPGVEIAAADLASDRTATVTSAPPVLDAQAKDEYRRRLDELDDAIDWAVLRHRDEEAEKLEVERNALLDELRRATGLGGRDRRLNDQNERIRKTVTARIRDTLRRLDDRHPTLGAHLRDSVRTGARCAYAPTDPVNWDLR